MEDQEEKFSQNTVQEAKVMIYKRNIKRLGRQIYHLNYQRTDQSLNNKLSPPTPQKRTIKGMQEGILCKEGRKI